MDNTVVISTPPHVKAKQTTRSIMLDVVIALLPCAIMGCVYFGWQALLIELTSVFACVLTEFVYYFIANKGFARKCKDAGAVCRRWAKQFDFTSVVTGLILALIIPTTDKWYEVFYEVIIGAVFAIAIVKMLFGGTGKNLVNPAAAARIFMFISFSLTTYAACNIGPVITDGGTLTSGATNLTGLLKDSPASALSVLDLFLGTGVAGCIGETSKAAILAGYIYLVARKIIKWWQPFLFLAAFGLTATFMSGFGFAVYMFDFEMFLPHVLSGGAVFAAVFMFPDYVTSPKGVWGQAFYYALSGLLLGLLRYFTHKEVVSFVIVLMNLIVPLIDKYMIRKPFGGAKAKNKRRAGK